MEDFIKELQFLPKVNFVSLNDAGDAVSTSDNPQNDEGEAYD